MLTMHEVGGLLQRMLGCSRLSEASCWSQGHRCNVQAEPLRLLVTALPLPAALRETGAQLQPCAKGCQQALAKELQRQLAAENAAASAAAAMARLGTAPAAAGPGAHAEDALDEQDRSADQPTAQLAHNRRTQNAGLQLLCLEHLQLLHESSHLVAP